MKLRIFISSPGDVLDERLRAGLVIDKLAQEFRRHVTFDVIRWEHEPLIASGHFQDALAPPSESDIVILILWSRLGTPLPPKTALREYRGIDGRSPVTGTEWEYEDALRAARERGAPDLLAFRNMRPTPIDSRDPAARAKSIAQIDALDEFWRRHFADRGVFLAAYDEYATIEDFAARLEQSLRRLIERRIAAHPSSAAGAATWFGSPFRGLEAYGFEHAPIYFGRDEAVTKAAEQLAGNARRGTAFLLVSGASGSGKSSLVQAALVPRLMQPQRIEGIAFARRLVFRPGNSGDPILGLVEALTCQSDDPRVGLPELLAAGQSANDLAAHLRETPDNPGFVFVGALSRLTDAARASGHLLAFESAKLILVVDQLEELFTGTSISVEDLRTFVRFIAGLARSGAVWVVATLRADFWHRAAEVSELLDLAQGLGRIDLAAPSSAELAEMIRKPAQAAGLAFETHVENGLGLDVVLAQDSAVAGGPRGHSDSAPGTLPLLSFVLDALYAEDVSTRGGHKLTFATYAALGGLHGAMSRRADETLASLQDEPQAAVPRVLRSLVTVAGGGEHAVVARVVPLARFGEDTHARAVIDAFTAARLIVATGDHASTTIRLAHEALIGNWERARQQFAADRRDLESRALVEQHQARWEKAAGKGKRQLLLRDPDLANALDLRQRWGDELEPATRAFIAASRQRARLVQRLTAASAVVFAVVALTASMLGVAAYRAEQDAQRERARAEQSLAAATETANGLIFDLAARFRNTSGVPVELIKDILERARVLQDQLIRAGTTPDLRRSQAVALIELATTLLDQGDTKGAFEAADRARQITQELLVGNPGNALWQRDLWFANNTVGDVQRARGNLADALKSYQAGFAIAERLANADPADADRQRDLSASYTRIGVVQQAQGDLAEALKSHQASLVIAERLAKADPGKDDRQHDLAVTYNKIGDLRREQGNLAEALASYQASLAIMERLATAAPGNAGWQHDVATCYEKIGAVQQAQSNLVEALKSYEAGHAIVERLAKADPGNAGWQHDLSISYNEIGDLRQAQGDVVEAQKSYHAALAIMERLAKADPRNGGWQRDLSISYNKVGDVQQAQGNLAEAIKSFQASLAIVEQLAEADPGDAGRQRDLSIAYSKIGSAQRAQGDLAEALKSYQADLAIAERLAKADPGNAGWQRDVSISYNAIGDVHQAQGNLAEALKSYHAALAIAVRLAKGDSGNTTWQGDLLVAYNKIGDVRRAQGDLDDALESYQAELAIAEHLAKADPGNDGWQRELVLGLLRISLVSEPADARVALERALAIVEVLARDGKLTGALQALPQAIRDLLAKLPP